MPSQPFREIRTPRGRTLPLGLAVRGRRSIAACLYQMGVLIVLAGGCTPSPPPAPTATLVPPTATPLPPTPTPTPRPEPSPDVRAYLRWLRPQTNMAGSALARLAVQQQQAAHNGGVVRDQAWLIPTRAVLVNLATAGNELQRYRHVPAGVEELNALVAAIGEDLVALGDAYGDGLARVDMQHMGAAAERLGDLESKLREAADEVQRLGGE